MKPIHVFKNQTKDEASSNSTDSSSSSSEGESSKIQLRRSDHHGLKMKIAKLGEPESKDKPMNL